MTGSESGFAPDGRGLKADRRRRPASSPAAKDAGQGCAKFVEGGRVATGDHRPSGRMVLLWLVVSVLALYARHTSAADGDLDPSFGTLGKVTTSLATFSEAADVALQSDGQIVVAGTLNSDPIARCRGLDAPTGPRGPLRRCALPGRTRTGVHGVLGRPQDCLSLSAPRRSTSGGGWQVRPGLYTRPLLKN